MGFPSGIAVHEFSAFLSRRIHRFQDDKRDRRAYFLSIQLQGIAMSILPLLTLALAALTATAEPDRSHLAAVTIDELKAVYLACDRRASSALLDAAEAAHCSLIHEELKQRAFGGDYARLLAWWLSQRVSHAPARSSRTHSQHHKPSPGRSH
jgi:hypothetical protein